MAKHKTEHPHSSSISCCEYDDATKQMHITFASGGKHRFDDVPKDEFDALTQSNSLGRHFHLNIRRKYTSTKVD